MAQPPEADEAPPPLWARRTLDSLHRVESWVAIAAFVGITGALFLDLLGRELLGRGIFTAQRFAVYCMVVVAFLGFALTVSWRAHLGIDVAARLTPARWDRTMERVSSSRAPLPTRPGGRVSRSCSGPSSPCWCGASSAARCAFPPSPAGRPCGGTPSGTENPTQTMVTLGLIALIAVLVVLRQSIVMIVALSVAYVHAFMTSKKNVEFLIQDVWYAIDREVLLSIPLFVFAGLIMARGSIAGRLVDIMRALTVRIPGGLGVATVLALTVFSAVCGASSVTMLAIGTIMYPALLQAGYSKRYALGVLCAGGTLGVIIPPSLLLILYGISTEVSITDLFKAGWGPGLLLAGSLCIYTMIVNRQQPTSVFAAAVLLGALRRGVWALAMPVILLGGIYTGWFTVTESAAVAVVYAILVELLVHRELKFRDLGRITLETVKMLGMLMPLLAIASSLNAILDLQGAPQALVREMKEWVDSPAMLLVLVNLVLLIAGALMDESSAILILSPLLAPMGQAYGFDPRHFGIIVTVNLQIGYVAPPVALNLIVAMAAFKEPFGLIVRSVLPFIAIMLAVLVVVCAYPPLTLFLLR